MAGDTFISYKKRVGWSWAFAWKVEPGVLRGWRLTRQMPEIYVGGLWKIMNG